MQVIDAAGWQADFVPEADAPGGEVLRVGLICFGLVEEPGRFSPQRRVVGLCSGAGGDIVPVTAHGLPGYRFAGYSHRDWADREVRLPDALGASEPAARRR